MNTAMPNYGINMQSQGAAPQVQGSDPWMQGIEPWMLQGNAGLLQMHSRQHNVRRTPFADPQGGRFTQQAVNMAGPQVDNPNARMSGGANAHYVPDWLRFGILGLMNNGGVR